MEEKLLIKNGTLVSWQDKTPILENGAVYCEDGLIQDVGNSEELSQKYHDVKHIDAQKQLVMPGNICTHTHFYGAFARGMSIPGNAPKDFPEILEKVWWPLDQALDGEAVRYSALVCLIDAIKHGTTTVIDHHASPNALSGSLDIIADAVEQAGLRAVLCYEATDRYGAENAQASIAENVRFANAVTNRDNIASMFGLHASLTLSEETLRNCIDATSGLNIGFHIHVAEHEADEYDSLQRYGKRVIERLAENDMLGKHTIVAHGVHINMHEAELLRDSGTWVTHQPRSNMNNGVGVADIEGMLSLGIPVCLGNDGFTNNMWAEWKTAYLLHKVWHRDPRRTNGMDIVQMAIHNNAALAQVFFPNSPPGYLVEGAAADIIFVDYHPTTPLNAGNLPWHILFGFESSMVTATIVAGKVLMYERALTTLDENTITQHSRELAPSVWQRYQQFVPTSFAPDML